MSRIALDGVRARLRATQRVPKVMTRDPGFEALYDRRGRLPEASQRDEPAT